MSAKVWGGRFSEEPDAIMQEINASIDFDKALFAEKMASKPETVSFLAEVLAKRQEQLQADVGTAARELSAVNSLKVRIKAFFNIR